MAERTVNLWNEEYAVLPFHPVDAFKKYHGKGDSTPSAPLRTSWEKVVEVLSRKIQDSDSLIAALVELQPKQTPETADRFMGLRIFFEKFMTDAERAEFFAELLPKIQQLALKMPDLVPHKLQLLHQGVTLQLTFSKHAIASLLAGAFFCILPHQFYEQEPFPRCSFEGMYEIVFRVGAYPPYQAHKLKCHLNYFRRVTNQVPEGNISFQRKLLTEKVEWALSTKPMTQLTVLPKGIIEDADGALHADFANKYIGGGALEAGCVQEEIMFTVQNELCAAMFFCSVMKRNEAILMIGSEQYSEYSGYGGKFQYVGDHVCSKEFDQQKRKKNYIVAIDALDFRGKDSSSQYEHPSLRRELRKAYIGFALTQEETERLQEEGATLAPIATGNWGGGAFLGNRPLKAILQWMAASQAGRDVLFYSFGQEDVTEPLIDLVKTLADREITVGRLWEALAAWDRNSQSNLFKYLNAVL